MPAQGIRLFDIMIVRQYLDEIDAISRKYDSKREDVIAIADNMENIEVTEKTVKKPELVA